MLEITAEITEWRKSKGFDTPSSIFFPYSELMLGKLMLVVTEVAEAAEAVRNGEKENFEEEIADTFIRLLDLCGAMGIDPEEIIEKKMVVNRGRPMLHGKKTTI